ncbi:16S rRNA processing protein RimM [Silvibacterium bohemicum]|uniref:Ribosome maturation factor RimM n=1 Tax=Silvibacterium bohemicum TaxID=1577686 RepID=A0A841JXK9_9BACT|nr:16S rRNA processing protein RimM [Silvibacterium bohemicum]
MRPQGRHGEVLADILTDFPERFSERKRLFLIASEKDASSAARNRPPREITLENHWLHKGRIVFKFAGIDSINDADTLRGLDVAIPASERAPLDDGAVYISDLIGCELVDLASARETAIGRVVNVDREASLLVVENADGAELLIPFTRAYLEKMDLAAKRIEMRLPTGLLDINAPLSEGERAEQRAQESGKSE